MESSTVPLFYNSAMLRLPFSIHRAAILPVVKPGLEILMDTELISAIRSLSTCKSSISFLSFLLTYVEAVFLKRHGGSMQ
jgi:hypothetical protein